MQYDHLYIKPIKLLKHYITITFLYFIIKKDVMIVALHFFLWDLKSYINTFTALLLYIFNITMFIRIIVY